MKRIFNRSGFQQRVVFSILAIGLVSVLLGMCSVYFFGRSALKDRIGDTYQELAQVTAGSLDKEVQRHVEEARTLTMSGDIVRVVTDSNLAYEGMGQEDIAAQLAQIEERWAQEAGVDAYLHALLTNVGTAFLKAFETHEDHASGHMQTLVADAQGAVVAATRRPRHFDFSKQVWWQTVMETGRPYISGIEHSPEDNTHLFSIAHPVQKDGHTIGVLLTVHNAPTFFRLVTDVRVGHADHTMLVASDGTVLFCPILPIASHNLSDKLQPKVLKNTAGWVSSKDDIHYAGRPSINGYAPVGITMNGDGKNFGGQQWYVVTSQDPDETFAPIYGLLKWVAVTGILGALVIAGLGMVAARRILQPIYVLREGVERVAAGNLDHTITVRSNDEIEDLAHAFNDMSEKLKASYAGLEAKIAERTRDLETKNRELFALYAIVSTLNQSGGIHTAFADSLSKVMVTLRADAIVLTIFGEAKKSPIRFSAPKGELEGNKEIAALEIIEKKVRKQGESLTLEDLRDSSSFNLLEKDLGYLGISSMAITSQGKVLGVLHLMTREPRAYTPTERTLIASIVNQFSVSIQNARLSGSL